MVPQDVSSIGKLCFSQELLWSSRLGLYVTADACDMRPLMTDSWALSHVRIRLVFRPHLMILLSVVVAVSLFRAPGRMGARVSLSPLRQDPGGWGSRISSGEADPPRSGSGRGRRWRLLSRTALPTGRDSNPRAGPDRRACLAIA